MKAIATILALALSSAAGFSQCMSHRVTARNEMHTASAVIVGTVTAAEPVAESWDFFDGVNYTVRVDSVIHGRTDRAEYRVFSENGPNAFAMTVGKHYVLYLQPRYDRYEVDECGNSHQTEELDASTKQVAKGY
jgi:hypothetical protein